MGTLTFIRVIRRQLERRVARVQKTVKEVYVCRQGCHDNAGGDPGSPLRGQKKSLRVFKR